MDSCYLYCSCPPPPPHVLSPHVEISQFLILRIIPRVLLAPRWAGGHDGGEQTGRGECSEPAGGRKAVKDVDLCKVCTYTVIMDSEVTEELRTSPKSPESA